MVWLPKGAGCRGGVDWRFVVEMFRKLGYSDGCTTINIIKFIEKIKRREKKKLHTDQFSVLKTKASVFQLT